MRLPPVRSARCLRVVTAALAAMTLLAACSGTGPTLPSTSSGLSATNAPGSVSLAPSPEDVAASGPTSPPNPFADVSSTPVGGREVIANPTLAEILETASPLPEMAWGQSSAPVTVVKYASLTCPYCSQFHADVFPRLKREYIDTGKVRFILREFPIGRTSGQASVALRCAKPEKYLDLYGRYLSSQPKWVSQEVRLDAVHAIAADVGLTRAQFDACRQDPKLVENLKLIKDRGRKLGIIGTPNFFIGTKLIKKALDWAALQAEIEQQLRSGGAVATAAKTPQN